MSGPADKAASGESDLIVLASAYLYGGLAKTHAVMDGNQRIAIMAAGILLELNGMRIETSDVHLFNFVVGVAAGDIDEDGATRFVRDFTVPL